MFNLSKFIKESAAKNLGLGFNPEPASPYDWQGQSFENPNDRKTHIEQRIEEILETSDTPLSDSYGALQKVPFQSGYGSPEHMLPINSIYRQLEAYVNTLNPVERKEFLNMWGGDLRNVIGPVLEKMGYPFNPALFDAFSQRMTPGKLDAIFQQPSDQIRAIAENHRKSWIKTLQAEVKHLYDSLVSQYNISAGEFTHLCYMGEVNPNKPSTNLQFAGDGPRGYLLEKLGGVANAANICNTLHWILYEHPRQLQASAEQTKRINHLFSGYNEQPGDRDIYPEPAPITREEILTPLGFTLSVYPPNKPSWEISKHKIPYEKSKYDSLTPEQRQEREAAWQNQRLDPQNLSVLKKYILEGGFEYGGLGALLSTKQADIAHGQDYTAEEGDIIVGERRYPARVIKYIFDQLCQRNGVNFKKMLEESGMGYLTEDLDQNSYPDPAYSDYNLVFRSQAEKEVVERLRKFGLMAVPMPISIPSPSDCVVNPRSFDIDFTIPCDVLSTWEVKYGQSHPVVQPTVIFVGEYFGFDRKQMINIPAGQEWRNPDGSIAQFKKSNGQVVDAVGGQEVERGFKYKVSTEWKKMCETYVSHMMGNATIFIEKDSKDRDIMAQLDNNHIIYKTESCPANDTTCCIAAHQMEQHLGQGCSNPECDARKYISSANVFEPKQYSRAEAYIISCIEDLKVRYGFSPVAKQHSNIYSSKEMYEYYKTYKQKTGLLQKLWGQYEAAATSKNPESANAILHSYNEVRKSIIDTQEQYMSKMKNLYNEQLNNPMYKVRNEGLNALLAFYREHPNVSDKAVARACAEYMSASPPRALPEYVIASA